MEKAALDEQLTEIYVGYHEIKLPPGNGKPGDAPAALAPVDASSSCRAPNAERQAAMRAAQLCATEHRTLEEAMEDWHDGYDSGLTHTV